MKENQVQVEELIAPTAIHLGRSKCRPPFSSVYHTFPLKTLVQHCKSLKSRIICSQSELFIAGNFQATSVGLLSNKFPSLLHLKNLRCSDKSIHHFATAIVPARNVTTRYSWPEHVVNKCNIHLKPFYFGSCTNLTPLCAKPEPYKTSAHCKRGYCLCSSSMAGSTKIGNQLIGSQTAPARQLDVYQISRNIPQSHPLRWYQSTWDSINSILSRGPGVV